MEPGGEGGSAPRARRRLGMGWAALGAGLLIGLVLMLLVFWLTR